MMTMVDDDDDDNVKDDNGDCLKPMRELLRLRVPSPSG